MQRLLPAAADPKGAGAARLKHYLPLALPALLSASAFGQTPSPQFEAVSVKIAGPPSAGMRLGPRGGPGSSDPGRFYATRTPMNSLLVLAFGVSADQFQGPKWLYDFAGAVYYDIEATMPPETTKEQFEVMLQNMLAERFHLVFRREKRNFPGYELVVDKGGPKFKEVQSDPDAAPTPGSVLIMGAPKGEDGFPEAKGPNTISYIGTSGLTRTKYQERTMAEFVSNLGFVIGNSQGKSVLEGFAQPRVTDKTGLKGRYTFILEYAGAVSPTLRALQSAARANPATESSVPASAEPPGGSDIITAIQKQLGLRLDKTADIPLDYIVIENVDKMPTPN